MSLLNSYDETSCSTQYPDELSEHLFHNSVLSCESQNEQTPISCFAKAMDSGKTASIQLCDSLFDHIEYGSLPINDAFCGHAMLVRKTGGREIVCNTKDDDSMAKTDKRPVPADPENRFASSLNLMKNLRHHLNLACFG